MAIAPLNEFRSRCINLSTTDQTILTIPASIATIVLDARSINVTGLGEEPGEYAYLDARVVKDNGDQAIIVPHMEIPPNDALEFIKGKFVLEEGDSLLARADGNNKLQLIISYLETSA